jgi:hypothetical protein
MRFEDMRPEGPMRDGLVELIEVVREQVMLSKIVEVGSCRGESTDMFATVSGRVYAVDPWEDYESIHNMIVGMDEVEAAFDKRFEFELATGSVVKLKMLSHAAAATFADRSVDLVYLDGDHTGGAVRQDITYWLPKVRHGGFLAGHDYRESENGKYDDLIAVVNELCGDVRVFQDSSWLIAADDCKARLPNG